VVVGFGLGGLIVGVWTVWTRRLQRLFRYPSNLTYFWSFGEVVRLMALLALVVALLPFVRISLIVWGILAFDDTRLWMVLTMVVLDGLLLFLVWGFAATKPVPLSAALGLSWRRAASAITQGLVGYLSVFPWIVGLLWMIVMVCQQLGIEPPAEPIQELLFEEQRSVMVGFTVVLACLVGPVAEEVFFRGVLFTTLRRRLSRGMAVLISGALFAAIHTNAIGFVPILILGCLLADLYERTGSLFSPIAVHVLHNTLLVGLGLTLKELFMVG
jgi:membrane protease YdiL (CAAX protease family)